uniref:Uncharacterized protein n=1 Tax=Asparagus officinalis TaxID=4686 RepID=Q2XNS9_ASPOF|nr:hypothetical protein 12.t00005 [Asparagus officinalis]ABB55343.1 hypothetical protein 9.t00004 [Asparagus officinalis]
MPTDTPSKAFQTRFFYRRGWNSLDVIAKVLPALRLSSGRRRSFESKADELSLTRVIEVSDHWTLTQFILVRLLEHTRFKLLRYWSTVIPNVGAAGPTVKADSFACIDLILKLLDAQVTRPTMELATRQRVLGTDLSLLRIQDKSPQTRILVSSSIGKRLNRQRVLGVGLSLLRLRDKILRAIRDKIPRAYNARILELKAGVFSWGKDEPKMGEEEFYILSPETEEEEFYILSPVQRKLKVGSLP